MINTRTSVKIPTSPSQLDISNSFKSSIAIATFIIVTDIAIVTNFPVFRQILGFVSFSVIPGLLILRIVKLNRLKPLNKCAIVTGLNISFLIFGGLGINLLSLAGHKLLSLEPVLGILNILVFVLLGISYKVNKIEIKLPKLIVQDYNLTRSDLILITTSTLFPLISIIGVFLLNRYGNGLILNILIISIGLYILFTINFAVINSQVVYPIVLFCIGLALLLMSGLITSHVLHACDIEWEALLFRSVMSNQYWDNLQFTSEWYGTYNSCLSVTLLPAIYAIILGIHWEFIFKLIFPLLFSVVPVVGYTIFRNFLSNSYSFIAGLFLLSQNIFITIIQLPRQEIALIFFSLMLLVLFNVQMQKSHKSLLLITFGLSLIVSHYTTAYICLILITPLWILRCFSNKYQKLPVLRKYFSIEYPKLQADLTLPMILLLVVFMFLWYSQITETQFVNMVTFQEHLVNNLGKIFALESRNAESMKNLIFSNITPIIFIRMSIVYTTLVLTTIGALHILFKPSKLSLNTNYRVLLGMSELLLMSTMLLPYVSKGYGLQRLYFQLIVVLAPAFVVGILLISRKMKLPAKIIFSTIILLLIISEMGVLFIGSNEYPASYTMLLNANGSFYTRHQVFDQEIAAINWLSTNYDGTSQIWGDWYSDLVTIYADLFSNRNVFDWNRDPTNSYIFLRNVNVAGHQVYVNATHATDISTYQHILSSKNELYDNGGAIIKHIHD